MRLPVVSIGFPDLSPLVAELAATVEKLGDLAAWQRTCLVCRCTEHRACFPPCSWVTPFLCSGCVESCDAAYTAVTGRAA